jgi:hypothetical protein
MEKKLRAEAPERFPVQPERGRQKDGKSAKSAPGVQARKGCFGVLAGVALAAALTLVAVAVWS